MSPSEKNSSINCATHFVFKRGKNNLWYLGRVLQNRIIVSEGWCAKNAMPTKNYLSNSKKQDGKSHTYELNYQNTSTWTCGYLSSSTTCCPWILYVVHWRVIIKLLKLHVSKIMNHITCNKTNQLVP